MHIGRAAKAARVSVDTVRFYEENGLLAKAPRGPGGFRLYGEPDVVRLNFVCRAKRMGFSLREIRSLITLREHPSHPCVPMHDRLEGKLREVRSKLNDLKKLEAELQRALRRCKRALKENAKRHVVRCPILEDAEREGGKAR